jgi:WD40 repeat protein
MNMGSNKITKYGNTIHKDFINAISVINHKKIIITSSDDKSLAISDYKLNKITTISE